jgi:hypothetical protein
LTETDDLARVNAELLTAFKKCGDDFRKLIRAEVGREIEFVVIAWDRTHGSQGAVPNVVHTYSFSTNVDAIRSAHTLLTAALIENAVPVTPPIARTLN